MASKKKAPEVKYDGPVFQIGTKVLMKRPNLHFGKSGTIHSVNPGSGNHIVRVTADSGAEYSALASGTEIEEIKLGDYPLATRKANYEIPKETSSN